MCLHIWPSWLGDVDHDLVHPNVRPARPLKLAKRVGHHAPIVLAPRLLAVDPFNSIRKPCDQSCGRTALATEWRRWDVMHWCRGD
eukprot:2284156-Prymnesium_polylepis.1